MADGRAARCTWALTACAQVCGCRGGQGLDAFLLEWCGFRFIRPALAQLAGTERRTVWTVQGC